jgi:hypothetical protein
VWPLHAQGIAVSEDGKVWLVGVGAYGKGWGNVGRGVSVRTGATLYIKYADLSAAPRALQIASHGSDKWEPFGPERSTTTGQANDAVILRIDKIGTSQSTATWINGRNTLSRGIIASGAYDLSLGPESTWTLPPIAITPKTAWWDLPFFHAPAASSIPADPVNASVPDRGPTLLLLAVGLLSAFLCWRFVLRRQRRAH